MDGKGPVGRITAWLALVRTGMVWYGPKGRCGLVCRGRVWQVALWSVAVMRGGLSYGSAFSAASDFRRLRSISLAAFASSIVIP